MPHRVGFGCREKAFHFRVTAISFDCHGYTFDCGYYFAETKKYNDLKSFFLHKFIANQTTTGSFT